MIARAFIIAVISVHGFRATTERSLRHFAVLITRHDYPPVLRARLPRNRKAIEASVGRRGVLPFTDDQPGAFQHLERQKQYARRQSGGLYQFCAGWIGQNGQGNEDLVTGERRHIQFLPSERLGV
jgi:hypothetical protein